MSEYITLPDPPEPVDAKLSHVLPDVYGGRDSADEIRKDLGPSHQPINTLEADNTCIAY
jgi:hypothetical protein